MRQRFISARRRRSAVCLLKYCSMKRLFQPGCVASGVAFTLAHLYVGPPVLWLAAFACGFGWAWMVVRTRSVVPGIVCHYLWDVAVIFVAPY